MTPRRSIVVAGLETIRDRVASLGPAGDADEPVLYECRRCGTAFDEEPERCPRCEETAIAAYRASTLR